MYQSWLIINPHQVAIIDCFVQVTTFLSLDHMLYSRCGPHATCILSSLHDTKYLALFLKYDKGLGHS